MDGDSIPLGRRSKDLMLSPTVVTLRYRTEPGMKRLREEMESNSGDRVLWPIPQEKLSPKPLWTRRKRWLWKSISPSWNCRGPIGLFSGIVGSTPTPRSADAISISDDYLRTPK